MFCSAKDKTKTTQKNPMLCMKSNAPPVESIMIGVLLHALMNMVFV